jgi:hypothetical protein
MAGSFSVTISNLSGLGATRRAEASEIAAAINAGIGQLVSAQQLAWNHELDAGRHELNVKGRGKCLSPKMSGPRSSTQR